MSSSITTDMFVSSKAVKEVDAYLDSDEEEPLLILGYNDIRLEKSKCLLVVPQALQDGASLEDLMQKEELDEDEEEEELVISKKLQREWEQGEKKVAFLKKKFESTKKKLTNSYGLNQVIADYSKFKEKERMDNAK